METYTSFPVYESTHSTGIWSYFTGSPLRRTNSSGQLSKTPSPTPSGSTSASLDSFLSAGQPATVEHSQKTVSVITPAATYTRSFLWGTVTKSATAFERIADIADRALAGMYQSNPVDERVEQSYQSKLPSVRRRQTNPLRKHRDTSMLTLLIERHREHLAAMGDDYYN